MSAATAAILLHERPGQSAKSGGRKTIVGRSQSLVNQQGKTHSGNFFSATMNKMTKTNRTNNRPGEDLTSMDSIPSSTLKKNSTVGLSASELDTCDTIRSPSVATESEPRKRRTISKTMSSSNIKPDLNSTYGSFRVKNPATKSGAGSRGSQDSNIKTRGAINTGWSRNKKPSFPFRNCFKNTYLARTEVHQNPNPSTTTTAVTKKSKNENVSSSSTSTKPTTTGSKSSRTASKRPTIPRLSTDYMMMNDDGAKTPTRLRNSNSAVHMTPQSVNSERLGDAGGSAKLLTPSERAGGVTNEIRVKTAAATTAKKSRATTPEACRRTRLFQGGKKNHPGTVVQTAGNTLDASIEAKNDGKSDRLNFKLRPHSALRHRTLLPLSQRDTNAKKKTKRLGSSEGTSKVNPFEITASEATKENVKGLKLKRVSSVVEERCPAEQIGTHIQRAKTRLDQTDANGDKMKKSKTTFVGAANKQVTTPGGNGSALNKAMSWDTLKEKTDKSNEKKLRDQGKAQEYQIGKILGQGAYAVVKAACKKEDGKKFAMKIYHKYKLIDPTRKRSVRREIKVMEKLEHKNVVGLIDTFDTEQAVNLVMENVEGCSLHDFIKMKHNGRLIEREAKKVFRQLIMGIDYCHSKNVAHRDIKLENILIQRNPQVVKLIDFGFSTCMAPEKKTRIFCGTPSYMAPEIIAKKEYSGHPADIWALGVVLYAIMSGTFPFKGYNDRELYRKIMRGSYHAPEYFSEGARHLLKKMLSVEPHRRPKANDILYDGWLAAGADPEYYVARSALTDKINAALKEKARQETEGANDWDPEIVEKMERLGYENEEIQKELVRPGSHIYYLYQNLLKSRA